MKIITKEMLVEVEACTDQVKIFSEIFPDGARVNKTNALKAAKAGLDIDWAAEKFLSESKLDDYLAKHKSIWDDYYTKQKPIDEDYYAKRKPIEDDYQAKRKLISDDYLAKLELLYNDYCAKQNLILDDYYAKHKPIYGDFLAKIALLFVEIYNS